MTELDRGIGVYTWTSDPIIITIKFIIVQIVVVSTSGANGMVFTSFLQYRFRFSEDLDWHVLQIEHTSSWAKKSRASVTRARSRSIS